MSIDESPGGSPATDAGPAPARRAPRPTAWLVLAAIGILALAGAAWALLGRDSTGSPAAGAPPVRALYYQRLDGAVLALDAATEITRTLLAPQAYWTRLLDTSPNGQRVAYLQSSRPFTATTWYAPVSATLRLGGPGTPPRPVPLPAADLHPDDATFLDDDTLLVQVAPPPDHPYSDLYLYSVAQGTTHLLATRVPRTFPFPELGAVLYTQELTPARPVSSAIPPARGQGWWALDVQGARTPQPVATTWTLALPAGEIAAWEDRAHRVVIYTWLADYPASDATRSSRIASITLGLGVLPVRPLGAPTPVATFTSDSAFRGALAQDARVGAPLARLQWWAPAATPPPGAPRGNVIPLPEHKQWAALQWTAAGPHLTPLAVPTTFADRGEFVPGGTLMQARAGGRLPFEFSVAPTDTVHLYDPATGRSATLIVPTTLTLQSYLYALDDRLLLVNAPLDAADAPVLTATLQLWLGEPAGAEWIFRSLGTLPGAGFRGLEVYGLAPGGASLLLGLPVPGPQAALPWTTTFRQGPVVTALYRVRLDGGGWQALDMALPLGITARPGR